MVKGRKRRNETSENRLGSVSLYVPFINSFSACDYTRRNLDRKPYLESHLKLSFSEVDVTIIVQVEIFQYIP